MVMSERTNYNRNCRVKTTVKVSKKEFNSKEYNFTCINSLHFY